MYTKPVILRWSDLDPNFHLRHSVYYDFGAFIRISFLNENGLTPQLMIKHQIGPIIFREECLFRKELNLQDQITIDLNLIKAKPDYSRWSIQHRFFKNEGQLAATVTVDGAWMNTSIRKLTQLPEETKYVFEVMPRSENFEWLVK